MLRIQELIKKFMMARDWDNLPPANLAKSVSIEAAELLEHFQFNDWTREDIKQNKDKYLEIQGEVADVIIYCAEMANVLSFDLEKAVVSKLKKASKKYPAKLFKNKNDSRSTADGVYYKIKQEYRKNKNI